MTLRALFVVILVLLGGSVSAAPSKLRPVPAAAAAPPPMVFYVAKGAPDACGRGCDSWIAVEGQVDGSAAPRFRKFLQAIGNRDLPIYLASPGGNLDQALAMGTMLRERGATARVGRTLVSDCGFEAQDSAACIKLKQSGRVLRGDIFTRSANCNSACPYLLLGATTREVAPDALLAVHSAKVVVYFRGDVQPPAEIRAAANQRGRERADRMLSAYIVKMGADIGLFDLARSIKFESQHVLTREEIARFGIDRREVAETSWKFENGGRSMVSKFASMREEGGKWRLSQWRVICHSNEQFELDFQRPAPAFGSTLPTVAISGVGPTPQHFNWPPAKVQGYEIWALRVTRASVQGLAAASQFEFTESVQAADGKRVARSAKFSTEGLAGALTTLAESCPPPKNLVLRQAVGTQESAAK